MSQPTHPESWTESRIVSEYSRKQSKRGVCGEGGIEKLPMVKDQPVSWSLVNVQGLITESKTKF